MPLLQQIPEEPESPMLVNPTRSMLVADDRQIRNFSRPQSSLSNDYSPMSPSVLIEDLSISLPFSNTTNGFSRPQSRSTTNFTNTPRKLQKIQKHDPRPGRGGIRTEVCFLDAETDNHNSDEDDEAAPAPIIRTRNYRYEPSRREGNISATRWDYRDPVLSIVDSDTSSIASEDTVTSIGGDSFEESTGTKRNDGSSFVFDARLGWINTQIPRTSPLENETQRTLYPYSAPTSPSASHRESWLSSGSESTSQSQSSFQERVGKKELQSSLMDRSSRDTGGSIAANARRARNTKGDNKSKQIETQSTAAPAVASWADVNRRRVFLPSTSAPRIMPSNRAFAQISSQPPSTLIRPQTSNEHLDTIALSSSSRSYSRSLSARSDSFIMPDTSLVKPNISRSNSATESPRNALTRSTSASTSTTYDSILDGPAQIAYLDAVNNYNESNATDDAEDWKNNVHVTSILSEKKLAKLKKRGINPGLYLEMRNARNGGTQENINGKKKGRSLFVGVLTGNSFLS